MKISVVIPAYNSAETIRRAVSSVLGQSRRADEILVVDDGSTDDTAAVVRTFGEKVRLIEQPNGGASVARNTGIRNAVGDWIAFLDADDQWLPDKLKIQTAFLKARPDAVWCYGNFYKSGSGRVIDKPVLPSQVSGDCVFEDYFPAYCRGFYAWTSTILVRRDVFERVGFFLDGMKRAQDTDMWFRIAYLFGQVGYSAEPLAVYHCDTPGSSTKVNTRIDFMIQLVERHLLLSAESGRRDVFLPCVSFMLYVWIRELVRGGNRKAARELMTRYERFLSRGYMTEMQFRLGIPFVGSSVVDMYLRLKDRLGSNRRRRGAG